MSEWYKQNHPDAFNQGKSGQTSPAFNASLDELNAFYAGKQEFNTNNAMHQQYQHRQEQERIRLLNEQNRWIEERNRNVDEHNRRIEENRVNRLREAEELRRIREDEARYSTRGKRLIPLSQVHQHIGVAGEI